MRLSGKRKQKLFIYLAVMLLMLICSGFTSPLYPHYTGLDSAMFQIFAKGILAGKVPYRDLFDHKGPIFFWLETLGYLFGGRTGVFLFQCLLMGLDLALIDRICTLFEADYPAVVLSFISVFFTLFQHGNLTEEFSTPFILCAVYFELRFLKSKEERHPLPIGYLYGLILGLLAFIRLNNAVVVCALLLCIVIALVLGKQWGNLLANIGMGLLGLVTVTVPVCFYYYRQGALYDMIYGTFLRNFLYAKENTHYPLYGAPLFFFCLFLPGICAAVIFIKKWKEEKNRVYLSLLFACLLTYGMLAYTNVYVHYFMLGLPVFTAAAASMGGDQGIRDLYRYLKKKIKRGSREETVKEQAEGKDDPRPEGKARFSLPGRCALFLLIVTLLYAGNSAVCACAPIYKTYLTDVAYNEYAQVQAGVSVIPEKERDSVIAYGVLANYYYHADIVPCYRFFTLQKWMTTEKVDAHTEFLTYVNTEHPLWVVTYTNENEKAMLEILNRSYRLAYADENYALYRFNGPEGDKSADAGEAIQAEEDR